jgi:acyl-CoA thioesterase-1
VIRSFFLKLAAGVILLGGPALSDEASTFANDTKKRIVILGDSITAGYGLNPDAAYPAVIQKKIETAGLPFVVTNAGVSGDTTAGGLRRVNWALSRGADILVIALGGNDGLRGIPPTESKKNLLGMIAKARAKNPEIRMIVAGMKMPDNMGPKFTKEFQQVFADVAAETKATLLPFLLDGVGGIENLNQADGIHPTAEGQKKIAETVWKTLSPLLKS